MAYPSHRLVLPTFTVQPSFWEKNGNVVLTQKGWTPLLQMFANNTKPSLCVFLYISKLFFWWCCLQGSGLHSSEVVQGMVFKREVEGNITKVKDAKVVVFSCPFDSMATETKVQLNYEYIVQYILRSSNIICFSLFGSCFHKWKSILCFFNSHNFLVNFYQYCLSTRHVCDILVTVIKSHWCLGNGVKHKPCLIQDK